MRIFSDSELKEMGKSLTELLDVAIDSGDFNKAKMLNKQLFESYKSHHDNYINWVTGLLSYIYSNYGDQGLNEALRESYGKMFTPLIGKIMQMDIKTRAKAKAASLNGHLQPLSVEEDDEKITFTMKPCGSGGMLVLENAYESPRNMAVVKKAQDITFGKEDFPIYCTHCAMGEILSIEVTGQPSSALEPGEVIGRNHCVFNLYKDANNIPVDVYARVGKQKNEQL